MNKKLFKHFFLLLLCMVTTGAWATSYIPAKVKTITETQNFIIAGTNKETDNANVAAALDEGWMVIPAKTYSAKGVAADPDEEIDIPSGTPFCLQVKKDGGVFNSEKRVIHMLVKGITGVKAIGQANEGRGFQIGATEYTEGMSEKTAMTVVAGNTSALNPVSYSGLDASKAYIISIFAYDSDTYLYAVRFTAPSGPKDPVFTVSKSTIAAGETTQLLVDGKSINGLITVLGGWSSTLSGITIHNDGTIKADNEGSATITFSWESQNSDLYNSGTGAQVSFTVVPPRVNPTFAVASSTIDQGGTTKIIVSGKDDLDGITLASATSSDETIATVDATTGVITGVGAGEATITFSTNQSDKYNSVENATVTVTVSNMIVPVITVKKTTLKVGEKITMLVNGNAWPLGEEDHILIDPNYNYYNSEYLTIDVNGGITAKAATPANASTNVNFKTLANSKYVVGEFNEYFKVIEGVTQTTVSEAATWDWSKFGTNEIKLLDAGTSPLKSDEFILAEVYNYGLTSDAVPEAFGDAAALKVTCEYPVRDGKYLQGGYVKFNTTVPGTVEVVFSNTGNRNDDETHSLARFLNINGVNTSASSLKSSETTTGSADVPAGEVIIKGTLNSDNSDQYLRIYKITFTPKETPSEADLTLTDADAEETNKAKILAMENKDDVTVTVDRAVTAGQWNTIYLPFAMNTDAINAAFGEGSVVAAYKEYVGGDLKFQTVNETEANTAYLINPANTVESFTAENVNVVYAADKTMTDITLMASGAAQFYGFLDNTEIAEPAVSIYYLATGNKIKRLATTGGTLKALHGYFLLGASDDEKFDDEFGANTLSFSIDGTTTGIVTVEGGEQKFVSGEMFNLAGQRVNDSYKGVVIVNGKKVIKK